MSVNSESQPAKDGERGILKTSAVTARGFNPLENKTILPGEVHRAKLSPKSDHIILSRMNTPALVGASAYVDQDFPNLFLPDRLWQINLEDKNNTNARWLSYLLASDDFRKKMSDIAVGTSGSMKNISKEKLLKLVVDVPSFREQCWVAGILSSVDEAIEAAQAVIEQTLTVKQAVIQRLLTKGIGHSRFKQTEIGEIPEGWNARPLAEVCRLSGGVGFPIEHQGHKDLPYPFVKVSDMNLPGNQRVVSRAANTIGDNIAKLIKARPFLAGTLIFPKVGAALLTNKRRILGQTSFVDNNIMTANAGPEIDFSFLFHVLCRINLSEHVQTGAVPSVNQKTVGSIVVPVPPREEQERIVQHIASLEAAEESLTQEQARRVVLKSALMSDLLTGRVRVEANLPMAAE